MTYDLNRFIKMQKKDYITALSEIKSGRKETHWMWYIFPQHVLLCRSDIAIYYGIESLEEAKAYLENEYLNNNLIEISKALVGLKTDNGIRYIMGYPDYLKLHSSMTLFHLARPEIDAFKKVVDKYYHGSFDLNTIKIIEDENKTGR